MSKNAENTKKMGAQDYQSLQDYLEQRYGAAIAQDLIEQIKKADDESYIPDYMDVKMLSDVLEDIQSDWFGYYAIIKQTYHALYKRAMAAFEVPSYKPLKFQTPERMAA